MSSEKDHLINKFEGLLKQYNIHKEKLSTAMRNKDYIYMKCATNDLIDFFNEMCKVSDQFNRRVGRDMFLGQEDFRKHLLQERAGLENFASVVKIDRDILNL